MARTPPILVLTMAKTSSFHPGAPNPSNKRMMAPQKKKKVDGNNGVTRTLPTISTRSSRKDPPEQEPMPSLRPVRGNRTPAPSPPSSLTYLVRLTKITLIRFTHLIIQTLSLLSIWHYYQKSQLPSILMMMTTSSVTIRKVYEVLVERGHSAMTKTTAKTHRTSNQNWRMMTCFILMMNY